MPAGQQPCRLTREELHGHLQECGFGRDADMFACYFYRQERRDVAGIATGGTTVVCATCGCGVGDHDGGGGDRPTDAVVGEPVMATAKAVVDRTEPDGRSRRAVGHDAADDGAVAVAFEPAALRFRSPTGKAVEHTVRVTNNSASKLALTARSNSFRYTTTPRHLVIAAGEAAEVTVVLSSPEQGLTSDRADDLVLERQHANEGGRLGRDEVGRIPLTELANLAAEPAAVYFPAPQDRRACNTVRIRNTTADQTYSVAATCTAPVRFSVQPQRFVIGPGESMPLKVCLYDPHGAGPTRADADGDGSDQRNDSEGAAVAEPAATAPAVRLNYGPTWHGPRRTATLRVVDTAPAIGASASADADATLVYLTDDDAAAADLPPGLVSDPQERFDAVSVDESGGAWKVLLAAHIVALVVGVPCCYFGAVESVTPLIIIGAAMLATTWGVTLMSGLPCIVFLGSQGPSNEVYTVRIEKPRPAGSGQMNGDRTVWVDRWWTFCSTSDPPFTVRDVLAVRLQHNAITKDTWVRLVYKAPHLRAEVLVFHGDTDEAEAVAAAWRAYLDPANPERLDDEVALASADQDRAPPPPPALPPGVEAKQSEGYDELQVDVSGMGWRIYLAATGVVLVVGIVLLVVGSNQQAASTGGSFMVIAGGLLFGFDAVALCLMVAIFSPLSDRFTVCITHPTFATSSPDRGGESAAAATEGYGERTVWMERGSHRCFAAFGFWRGGQQIFRARDVASVRVEHNDVTSEAVVGLVVGNPSGGDRNIVVFKDKTADPETVAAAWRTYLDPANPSRLKEAAPAIV